MFSTVIPSEEPFKHQHSRSCTYLLEMFLKCVISLPLEVEYPEHDLPFHSQLSRPPVPQETVVSAPETLT